MSSSSHSLPLGSVAHEHVFARVVDQWPQADECFCCDCGLSLGKCPHLDVYGPAPQEQQDGALPFHCVSCGVDRTAALSELFTSDGGAFNLSALPECVYKMRINNWVSGTCAIGSNGNDH